MSDKVLSQRYETLTWVGAGDGHLQLIDQTLLPETLSVRSCYDPAAVWEAIRGLRVRGAPAIGLAAAYGVCVGLRDLAPDASPAVFLAQVDKIADYLATSRPTAVNLFWALERMRASARQLVPPPTATDSRRPANDMRSWREGLLAEARRMHDEDREVCRAIGRYGAELLQGISGVLTHCNAGGLATSELGTALAVIVTAHGQGVPLHVFVDETRPLLQGSRLTAWELQQAGVPLTLICDSMAGQVMKERRVQAVVTGADRIAANGDAANKIGTYSLAVLAQAHGIPFYVAAPLSTFDLQLDSGDAIPIEQRDPTEITAAWGHTTAPQGINVYNPAFDVTPAALIRAIITERGIIHPVTRKQVLEMCQPTSASPSSHPS